MLSKKIFILALIFLSAALFPSCKDETPVEPKAEVSVICYSNLYWAGGDNHYWSIYTINTDGSDDKKFVESSIGLSDMEWSPDGTKILVDGMVTPTSPRSVYVMNADGSNLLRLTQLTDAVSARWSPDGRKIVFTKYFIEQHIVIKSEIWIMNSDGSDPKNILEGAQAKYLPNWTKLIYTSNASGNSEIYTCNIDGTNKVKLTNTNADEWNVDVSADGSKIVYSSQSNSSNENTLDIYVMNIDGTNVTRLTNNNYLDDQARWSPDGKQIAYCYRNATGKPEVYIMNSDGTNVKKVTNANGRSHSANMPSWKPKK
ncbi:MAG: DUF5050 domain-containing protein [Melioribacteraceae bacterium]